MKHSASVLFPDATVHRFAVRDVPRWFAESDRRARCVVVGVGIGTFVVFAALIITTYWHAIVDRRADLLYEELPRLVAVAEERIVTGFSPVTQALALLATREDWQERLDRAVGDPAAFRATTEHWAAVLAVADVVVVDKRREVAYAYWSEEPIQMDRTLERDSWYFSVWTRPNPPERRITFYYDADIGGHMVFFDQLVRSPAGEPIAIVGALIKFDPIVADLSADLLDGEFVYLLSRSTTADAAPIMGIRRNAVHRYTPVYTVAGREDPDGATFAGLFAAIGGADALGIAADCPSGLTADGRYAVGTIALPFDDVEALVVLNVATRVGVVGRAAIRQMVLLLAAFTVLIGGFVVLVAFYSRQGYRRLAEIRAGRQSLDDLVSILTHNIGNDLHSLRRLVAAAPSAVEQPAQQTPTTALPPDTAEAGCEDHQWALSAETVISDMENVLQNAIHSARIDTGPVGTCRRLVDPTALAERIFAACEPLARAKQQQLRLQIAGTAEFKTDEDLLYHILLNLVSNAIKFGPCGSTVVVAQRQSDRQAQWLVVDQGPGFSTADRDGLFTRHARLSARPTNGERSTGIGLFVARYLADLIGADLQVLDAPPPWLQVTPADSRAWGAVWQVRVGGGQ